MAVVRNSDIEVLEKISSLLDRRYHTFNTEEMLLVDNFNGIVQRFKNTKKELSEKNNNYNKAHKEYHRISVNMYAARKSGNIERAQYWENELNKLKEKNVNE